MTEASEVFDRLMAVIEARRAELPSRSYTTRLLTGGVEIIGQKVLEEAAEVVDAARQIQPGQSAQPLVHEAADLLYHLFVMLGYHQVRLEEVTAELARRFGTSGVDEKASRTTRQDP